MMKKKYLGITGTKCKYGTSNTDQIVMWHLPWLVWLWAQMTFISKFKVMPCALPANSVVTHHITNYYNMTIPLKHYHSTLYMHQKHIVFATGCICGRSHFGFP